MIYKSEMKLTHPKCRERKDDALCVDYSHLPYIAGLQAILRQLDKILSTEGFANEDKCE